MVDNMLVDNFLSMLRNRQKKGLLDFKYSSNIKPKYYEDDEVAIIRSLDGLSIYNDVRKIIFEIKQNDNLISLAKIEKHNISIDISEKNLAGEYNIVNGDTGYIITKTLASFLNNKIWAWLDRGRNIWKIEKY